MAEGTVLPTYGSRDQDYADWTPGALNLREEHFPITLLTTREPIAMGDAELLEYFDAWGKARTERTRSQSLWLKDWAAWEVDYDLLVADRHDAAPTSSPAEDLRRWLAPQISIASIAKACGVSERGFYGWLEGGGMREKNARRLHQLRATVQALMLRMDRSQVVEWLLTPQASLDLTSPIEALGETRYDEVVGLLTEAIPARSRPPRTGPVIAEDTAEDFDTFELTSTASDSAARDRRKRRRRRR